MDNQTTPKVYSPPTPQEMREQRIRRYISENQSLQEAHDVSIWFLKLNTPGCPENTDIMIQCYKDYCSLQTHDERIAYLNTFGEHHSDQRNFFDKYVRFTQADLDAQRNNLREKAMTLPHIWFGTPTPNTDSATPIELAE